MNHGMLILRLLLITRSYLAKNRILGCDSLNTNCFFFFSTIKRNFIHERVQQTHVCVRIVWHSKSPLVYGKLFQKRLRKTKVFEKIRNSLRML